MCRLPDACIPLTAIFLISAIFQLYLNNHWQNHGPPFCFLEKIRTQSLADIVADVGVIYRMHFIRGFFNHALYEMARVSQKFVGFFEINKTARDYIRRTFYLPGSRVNRRDDHENAVLRKHPAVSQNHLLYVSAAQPA